MPNTTEFKVNMTAIPGLLEIDITEISDPRGYFQEKFQKAKLAAVGLPVGFSPVQQNISYNKEVGVTRGIHAEPWDKYVTVISGKVFGAWVDLRKENFGKVHTAILDKNKAMFVPRGVANAYQTLEKDVYYSYLVNDHWKAEGIYKSVNLVDPKLAIAWPISFDSAIVSDKDRKNPNLEEIESFEE